MGQKFTAEGLARLRASARARMLAVWGDPERRLAMQIGMRKKRGVCRMVGCRRPGDENLGGYCCTAHQRRHGEDIYAEAVISRYGLGAPECGRLLRV